LVKSSLGKTPRSRPPLGLAPGMLANIVILNKDPFVVPTQELHQIEVDSTIFDGRVIYKKN